ncbi:MAG: hypothetical protein ACFB8W_23695 [Elainellaceae cyanobacterium]
MLCDACQKQTACLPAQLSQTDPQIRQMLDDLKTCDVQAQHVQPASGEAGNVQTPSLGPFGQTVGDHWMNWTKRMGDRLFRRLAC